MNMNIKKIAGICILIPVLLTGCGSKSDTPTADASTSQPTQQTEKAATNGGQTNQQNRAAMDPAQRQLFTTIQSLVMMDKADGTAITKEQAQTMLPIAQDIEAKKELSDENKTKLLASLTDAQKTFLTDAESRMGNRGNGASNGQGANVGGQGNATGGTVGTATTPAPDASAQPKATDSAGNGQQAGGKRPNGGGGGNAAGSNGGNGGNRPAGGQMGDPAKQLVELLQTKLK
jgi:hypothetical protein